MQITKRIYSSFFLLVFFAAMLGGCAPSIKMQSNLDPGYRVNLDKIFVVLDTRQLNDVTRRVAEQGDEFGFDDDDEIKAAKKDTISFRTHFLEQLQLSFDAVNVEFRAYSITGIELSDEEITAGAEEFDPDAILYVKETFVCGLHQAG